MLFVAINTQIILSNCTFIILIEKYKTFESSYSNLMRHLRINTVIIISEYVQNLNCILVVV